MVAMTDLAFRPATLDDIEALVALVNSAYRGDASRAGWTTEADLITGPRIDGDGLRELINAPGSLLLLCLQGGAIIGSVHLKRLEAHSAYLGLFVVQPTLQGSGIGRRFLAEAEATVQQAWGSRRMTMSVITIRPELVAYYERRGYRRTGELHPFPTEAGASRPVVEDLQLETLAKDLLS
ncbi:MAG: GNAT family N-acetyltransferase [Holophagaceae bacterium]|nr:GNAT family N-acetyltransferase [Holophagaceae bacterium]